MNEGMNERMKEWKNERMKDIKYKNKTETITKESLSEQFKDWKSKTIFETTEIKKRKPKV